MTKDNKLGITDEAQLAKKEEEISKKKCVELFEKGILNKMKSGSSEALIKIHKYMFDEIYDCAGKLRGDNDVKKELDKISKMPQKTTDEFIAKLVAVSKLEPFETGNGRAIRMWLDTITRKEFQSTINWSNIDKELYIKAINASDKDALYDIVQAALTNEIENREVIVESIDASFKISGYDTYRTRVLG